MDFLEIGEVEQHGYNAYHIPEFGQTQTYYPSKGPIEP